MLYRDFKITPAVGHLTQGGFSCPTINCFGGRTVADVQAAIDRYLDGDADPQCRNIARQESEAYEEQLRQQVLFAEKQDRARVAAHS